MLKERNRPVLAIRQFHNIPESAAQTEPDVAPISHTWVKDIGERSDMRTSPPTPSAMRLAVEFGVAFPLGNPVSVIHGVSDDEGGQELDD